MTAMPDCEPKDLSIQKYEIVNANEDNTTATEEETKETSAKTENEIQVFTILNVPLMIAIHSDLS